MKLLLAGMALSAVCSAFSSFIVYFANNKEGMQSIAYWLMGSLAGAKWNELAVIAPVIIVSVLFFWTQSRVLNLMLLGDETAITMGTDLHLYRQWYLLISSLIVDSPFTRRDDRFRRTYYSPRHAYVPGPDHKKLIPASALVGLYFLSYATVSAVSSSPIRNCPSAS